MNFHIVELKEISAALEARINQLKPGNDVRSLGASIAAKAQIDAEIVTVELAKLERH